MIFSSGFLMFGFSFCIFFLFFICCEIKLPEEKSYPLWYISWFFLFKDILYVILYDSPLFSKDCLLVLEFSIFKVFPSSPIDGRHAGGWGPPGEGGVPLDPAEPGVWQPGGLSLPALLLPLPRQLLPARQHGGQPVDAAQIRRLRGLRPQVWDCRLLF